MLLANDKSDDLSRMYRLFNRLPKGLEPMAEIIKDHITEVSRETGGRGGGGGLGRGEGAVWGEVGEGGAGSGGRGVLRLLLLAICNRSRVLELYRSISLHS